jgi:redox-sensitive bicupin YhaK (pirin superfamily)
MSGKRVTRRQALKLAAATGATVAASGCSAPQPPRQKGAAVSSKQPITEDTKNAPGPDPVLGLAPLDFQWPVLDPFIFCVHHDDRYPAGNEVMGPAASLQGRELGMDFAGKDGWRMYHGEVVPGFPQHPHRGFETVTVVRRGLLDHSDSLGATARYGQGDVQWLTAGSGIQHAEMFPLIEREGPNPVELFQLWLNLPRQDKMVAPHFTMLWSDAIPKRVERDAEGRSTQVSLIAGRYADVAVPKSPPSSYASRPEADVAIWTIAMAPLARWTLPAAAMGSNRALYFFRGSELQVGARRVGPSQQLVLRADAALELRNGPDETELLLLQGRPIAEPMVQHGPFVMNTREEIMRAYADYRATGFGGWPWQRPDPVHPREQGRFARHADGKLERPA